MGKKKYLGFLNYIFDEYIRNRLPELRRRYSPNGNSAVRDEMDKLMRSGALLNFIQRNCVDIDDAYHIFNKKAIEGAISSAERSAELAQNMAGESGTLDALEDHMPTILEDLTPEYLPEYDREVLKNMDVRDAELELLCLITRAKTIMPTSERFFQRSRRMGARRRPPLGVSHLRRSGLVAALIRDEMGRLERDGPRPEQQKGARQRRPWTGISEILKGTALTIVNISLAADIIPIPVPLEAKTIGAVTSAATGLGNILAGIGHLLGE